MRNSLFIFLFFAQTLSAQKTTLSEYAQFDSIAALPNQHLVVVEFGKKIIAQDFFTNIPDSAQTGKVLYKTALAFLRTGMSDSTIKYTNLAYQFSPQNSENQLLALQLKAGVRLLYNDYIYADSCYKAILEKRKTYFGKKDMGYYRVMYAYANSKLSQNKLAETEQLSIQAIAEWNENQMPEHPILALLYSISANVKRSKGQFQMAEKQVRAALAIREKQPNGSGPPVPEYVTLVALLTEQGRYEEALEENATFLGILDDYAMQTTDFYIVGMTQKAQIESALGLNEIAKISFQKILEKDLLIGRSNNTYYPENMANYANLLVNTGELEEAKKVLDAAQDTVNKYNFQELSVQEKIFEVSTYLAMAQKKYSEAEDFAQKNYNLFKKSMPDPQSPLFPSLLCNIATAQFHLGDAQKALETLGQITKPENGDLQTIPEFRRISALKTMCYRAVGNVDLAAAELRNLAKNEETVCLRDLYYLTENQRLARINEVENTKNLALRIAAEGHDDRNLITAIDISLFHKSLLLNTAQKIREGVKADPNLAPIFEQFVSIREELAFLYGQNGVKSEQITEFETRADSLETVLSKQSTAYSKSKLSAKTNWKTVQNNLKTNEAALEIIRRTAENDDEIVIYDVFIIKSSGLPKMLSIEKGSVLENQILEKYLLENSSPKSEAQVSRLYEDFWADVEPHISNITRIYVSNDGVFHKINLAAIKLENGNFLGDAVEILPVFTLLALKIEPPSSPIPTYQKKAILVGNPDFAAATNSENTELTTFRKLSILEKNDSLELRDFNLNPLPGSEKEVREIAKLFVKSGWQTETKIGTEATEATIKSAQSPQVLHIATHGYFLQNTRSQTAGFDKKTIEQNPMLRSMLFFSGAQNALNGKQNSQKSHENGILTAYEAQNLNLENTELVVLSACKTALGKVQNGEGVFGLQRAFHIAGADALIVSLWDVEDKVAAEFMSLFYEKWLSGRDLEVAFRETQLAVKAQHFAPFYWAGFVLIK